MSRFLLIVLSLAVFVSVTCAHEGDQEHAHPHAEDIAAAVIPLEADKQHAIPVNAAVVAAAPESRPKRQYGLGLLLGSALGGGYGYGYGQPYRYGGYGGYGGYGQHHHYGHGYGGHNRYYGGYGYGR